MKLEELSRRLREEETLIRAIVRLLDSDGFAEAWATSQERDCVPRLIKVKNLVGLRAWYKRNQPLSDAGMVGLRKMASCLGIKNYNSYPKDALIAEIARLRKDATSDITVSDPPTSD